ncbi:MAG: ATP-binding protein, partial [Candidatus Limnocylindria bacterium]
MPSTAVRTYLFADLRDYTAFVEAHGDAAATRLIRGFRRIVRDAIGQRGGAEIKTEGDSFYVVFETPGNAVRAAAAIQRRCWTHNKAHPDRPIRVGIGINIGEAVAHEDGYVGAAVIIASRLASQASAGSILLTDTVRGLIRTAAIASMEDRGAWTLKGVSSPVRVFEIGAGGATRAALAPSLPLPSLLLPAPSSGAPGIIVSPRLVQRGPALDAVRDHVRAATRGERRLVAVVGEAGIGKSRLVREIASIARNDGMYVFGGRAHARADLPYEPFRAALRPYAHARGTEVLRRLLGPLFSELRLLLPELPVEEAPVPEIPDDERRERFLRAIQLLLEDAAAQRPVLLVLEDLHDADAATRDLLLYLAMDLRAGVCVLMTYRQEELSVELRASIGELDRSRLLATVPLEPLDRGGVEEMTRALVGSTASDDLIDLVHARSQGVPFYVEELLKTALDDPRARLDELTVPRSIAESVRTRLDRLVRSRGDTIIELLELISIAGTPLSFDAISVISGHDESSVAADVAAAIDAQLLERPATRTEIYQFRHALTRDAIESAIPAPRRRVLHLRVAAGIDPLPRAPGGAAFLARHYADGGATDAAFRYLTLAALESSAVGAYTAAAGQLRDAVGLAADDEQRSATLRELAIAHRAAGDPIAAEKALDEARTLAVPAMLPRLDVLLASVLRMQGRRADALIAIQRAEAALELNGGPDLAEAVTVHAELRWAESDAARAAALAERALALATEDSTAPIKVRALTVLGAARTRSGDDSAPQRIRQAIDLAMTSGQIAEAVNAYYELARAELFRSDANASLVTAETGMRLARERGLAFAHARLLSLLTTICTNVGRYAEARTFAEQALAAARPDTIASYEARVALAHVLANLGEYETALSLLDEIARQVERGDPDRRMTLYAYRAQTLVGLGRVGEAFAAGRKAVDIAVANPGMGMVAFLNAADAIEAARDTAAAEALLRTFDDYFGVRSTAAIRVTRLEITAIITA